MLKSYELSRPLSLVLVPPQRLSGDVQGAVDALWAAAIGEQPGLFDGPILTVVDLSPGRLLLAPASYRLVIATRRDPGLAQVLKLRPLAVSGILASAEGLVFGCGAHGITQGGVW